VGRGRAREMENMIIKEEKRNEIIQLDSWGFGFRLIGCGVG